jgi:DNA invertase Pin-like site-specific DNA recombinase
MQEYIAYRRVRASEQKRPGLGLEAQAAAILRFVQSREGVLLQDFVEIEAGRASRAPGLRPRLRDAVQAAKQRGAVLVVSRLDRLSRDAEVLAGLLEEGVAFAAAETPEADASMLRIHAAVAGREREQAARRISAALQAKKTAALAQGRPNPLGNLQTLQPHNAGRRETARAFAAGLASTLQAFRGAGMTQRAMVEELNRQGIPTAGGRAWSLVQLQRVLARLGANTQA